MLPFKKTVLLVEGRSYDRELLKQALLSEGIQHLRILEADSGKGGLKLAEVSKVSAIVMEWELPDFTGEEFLAGLLARFDKLHIPIFLYSRNLNSRIHSRARDYGVKNCFCKTRTPPMILAQQVCQLLGGPENSHLHALHPIALTTHGRPLFLSSYG